MSEQEISRCYELGLSEEDINRKLTIDDLAKEDDLFKKYNIM